MQSSCWTQRIGTLLAVGLIVAAMTDPVTGDPLLTEQKKLIAPDPTPVALFGRGVSLSADGKTLLVVAGADCWTAYVFARSGNAWSHQQKLTAPARPASQWCGRYNTGTLSGDGNTALIGNEELEAAWVFVRSGSTWIQQQRLTPTGAAAQSGFGRSVVLSADGNTALLGAPNEAAAYVFVRNDNIWAQQQKLIAPDPGELGWGAASLSGDGNTALVISQANCWTAYVYARSGNTWGLQQTLTAFAPGTCANFFGHSTGTLSGDGNTALIGFYAMHGAWVFVRGGETWTQQQKLAHPDDNGFGGSVALNHDGNTALVGAQGDDCVGGWNCGAAYLFARSGNAWIQQQKLTSTGIADADFFGRSVALDGKGDTAVVGTPQDDCPNAHNCGAAYVFYSCHGTRGPLIIDPDCIDLVRPPFESWIPVGCEIVDCCPGCPGLDRIDWGIRVDGDPIEAVILRFENLHPAMVRQLRIEGDARWLKGNRLQIKGQGETIIRGFLPPHSRSLRWSSLSPRMTLDGIVAREGATRLGGQAGATVPRTGTVRVRVEQKVGDVTINHSSLVYRYRQ